jgi:hypothetical protein
MEERSGSEVHLASWDERERAAEVLRDEILRVSVLMLQQSNEATRASALSAKSRHRW